MKKIIVLFSLIGCSMSNIEAQDSIIQKVTPLKQDSIVVQTPSNRPDSIINPVPLVKPDMNKYNFRQFGREAGRFVTMPIRWKGRDWIKFGVVAAGTFLLMQEDVEIRNYAQNHQKYANTVLMEVGNQWGGFFLSPAMAIGLSIHGWAAKNNKTKKLGFEIAEAVLFSETVHILIKTSTGRARPYKEVGAFSYTPFNIYANKITSFPAGHLSNAMAFSVVLSRNAKKKIWKILAFVPTAVTVVSRIYQDHHWTSDVFLGCAIGYFVGDWVVDQHEKKESRVQVSSIYPLSIKIGLN